jgi:hypothetical protein
MTDERDPKLRSAYRALGAEEPPRALDEAILGAARQSAQPWTRRWAVPLSLAAVVVLSVTVTLRVQHEQPGIEQPAPVRKEEQVARQAAEPVKPAAEPVARAPQQKSMPRKEAQAFPSSAQDRAVAENRVAEAAPARPAAAAAPAPQMEAPALAKRADAPLEVGSAAGSVAAPPAPAPAAAAPAMRAMQRDRVAAERSGGEQRALTPEQELERIAELRKQGKHDEADKALAEFRKRYPEFKIPPAMLERVERR